MVYEALFKNLMDLEAVGIRGSRITSDGYFKYHDNMPTLDVPAHLKRVEPGARTWDHPRGGDILLSFNIEGAHDHVEFYQYDHLGCRKIIYWNGHCDGPVAPFEDGIPLLQVGKSIYITVHGSNLEETKVSVRYAMLDAPSRREISTWCDGNGRHGVKIMHKDGITYQVLYVCDWSYSPNTLVPIY